MFENGTNGNLSVTYQECNDVRLTWEEHTNDFYIHAFGLACNVFDSHGRNYSGGGWNKCANILTKEQYKILNVNDVFY